MLTGLISSGSVYCVAHTGQKNYQSITILTKFSYFWPSPYRPGPNLAGNSRPMVYAYMSNFIWIGLLCHLPLMKNCNFWQMLTFRGLLYRGPFTNKGQIWCARADPQSTFMC